MATSVTYTGPLPGGYIIDSTGASFAFTRNVAVSLADGLATAILAQNASLWTAGAVVLNTAVTLTAAAGITALDLSGLILVPGSGVVTITDNTALASLDISDITTFAGALDCHGNALLTVVTITSAVSFGGNINFSGCALLAASINSILARAVAASMTSHTINLSGGTNAAPTGQGVTDKATLIAAGVTVTTN